MNPRLRLPLRSARSLAAASDERLADLARAGSSAAFDALAARHRRDLVHACTRVLGRSDAEEAVQEALLSAHLRLASGQVVHAPGAWLRVIARHTALNMLRARAARPALARSDLDRVPDQPRDPEQPGRLSELVDAVASLPERQRHAIVMRELEGRSYEEIAARLGATDGAVRQLLSRARGTLRTRLGTVAGFEPIVRLALAGGGGLGAMRLGAMRLGALSGGCLLTVKLGATALFPALPASSAPARIARAPAQAAAVRPERASPSAHATTAVPAAYRRATAARTIVALARPGPREPPPATVRVSHATAAQTLRARPPTRRAQLTRWASPRTSRPAEGTTAMAASHPHPSSSTDRRGAMIWAASGSSNPRSATPLPPPRQ